MSQKQSAVDHNIDRVPVRAKRPSTRSSEHEEGIRKWFQGVDGRCGAGEGCGARVKEYLCAAVHVDRLI